MAFTPVDRELLKRCLGHEPGSWNEFVDRFLGMFYHVIHYTAHLRSVILQPEDVEDVAAEILMQIIANDYKLLREFRGKASLATYLTVIARRICTHELTRRTVVNKPLPVEAPAAREQPRGEAGIENVEEVQRLLRHLPSREREIVRRFYLEGRSYEEISTELHIPINTIGPILARARKRLKVAGAGGEGPRPGEAKT
jgi:RNA polymerase sigma-70 factor (ECF subfamily)